MVMCVFGDIGMACTTNDALDEVCHWGGFMLLK